jgi:hypothetical protein
MNSAILPTQLQKPSENHDEREDVEKQEYGQKDFHGVEEYGRGSVETDTPDENVG